MTPPSGHPGETYQCGACGGTFIRGRPDAEAITEMRQTWQPHEGDDELATVCDDCFQLLLARVRAEAPWLLRDPGAAGGAQ